MLLARLGAQVVTTDLPQVMSNLEHNLYENLTEEELSRVTLTPLAWGDEELARNFMSSQERPFDCVFLGDCVYNLEVVEPVLELLHRVAGPRTEVFLSGIARPNKDDPAQGNVLKRFLTVAPKFFDCHLVWTPRMGEAEHRADQPPLPFPTFASLPAHTNSQDDLVRGIWLLKPKR